ncbi:VOC family protein [Algoriphagus sp. AGSA1]|uniref:VOC family protein n=1 Tax=Algoriphagus sp. AGSA1 TaxID=2907213 RepID=UPI001F488D6B|nr:VOC family protein [Algoriphagus sp. AGSA1]MCE7053069.1 VOC family protein [Algoriphagus sp. AGSA1]
MTEISVGWFEIPVTDMDRAIVFYQKIFDCKLQKIDLGEFQLSRFPGDGGGSLVYHKDFYQPSDLAGPLIYFSSDDVSIGLAKVEAAGGTVQIPKKMISPEFGYMGVFLDSEGNRIALHSKE